MADSSPLPSASQRNRRWFQFSLRTLLTVMLVAGCGLGWVGMKVQQGRRQKAAADTMREAGAYVLYDWEIEARQNGIENATPYGPAWLRTLLGDDFFVSVQRVELGGDFTDAQLQPLQEFTNLESFGLSSEKLTDAALQH